MSWDTFEKRIDKGPVSAIMTLVFFGAIALVAIGGCTMLLNPFYQAGRVVSKTIDADNMIYNYEWFKLRHEGILALDNKIVETTMYIDEFENGLGDRKEWDREDKEEHSRLKSVLLGLKQQKSDLAGEYNAKSRMVNRKIFKMGDVELPERIEL